MNVMIFNHTKNTQTFVSRTLPCSLSSGKSSLAKYNFPCKLNSIFAFSKFLQIYISFNFSKGLRLVTNITKKKQHKGYYVQPIQCGWNNVSWLAPALVEIFYPDAPLFQHSLIGQGGDVTH